MSRPRVQPSAQGNVATHKRPGIPIQMPTDEGMTILPFDTSSRPIIKAARGGMGAMSATPRSDLPPPKLTVFRVKRHREDDAMDTLVLEGNTSKALRSDEDGGKHAQEKQSAENATRIFRRVVTVEEEQQQDAKALHRRVFSLVRKARHGRKTPVEAPLHKKAEGADGNVAELRRQANSEKKLHVSSMSRFRIVNNKRQLSQEHSARPQPPQHPTSTSDLRVIDLERDMDSNDVSPMQQQQQQPRQTPSNEPIMYNRSALVREYVTLPTGRPDAYVYDVYYLAETTSASSPETLGRVASVVRDETFDEDLLFDDDEDMLLWDGKEYDDDDDDDAGDEDSNAEDNPHNDYPDEEDDDSDDEEEEEEDEDGVNFRNGASMRNRYVDADNDSDEDEDLPKGADDENDDDDEMDNGSGKPQSASDAAYASLSAQERATLHALRKSMEQFDLGKGSKFAEDDDNDDDDDDDGDLTDNEDEDVYANHADKRNLPASYLRYVVDSDDMDDDDS